MLTWELQIKWKKAILWDALTTCKNNIVELFYGKDKWKTDLGKEMRTVYMEYGKDCTSAKELKKRLKLFVEGMAAIKGEEEEEVED